MALISNLVRFSDHFKIDEGKLDALGVLNPTLNIDTRLFIDPMLLSGSSHREISRDARSAYNEYFTLVIQLLRATKKEDDPAWKAAYKRLSFPEIKWTCLGYGASSVSGSGSGRETTKQVLNTAKQIVALGIEDPDLFVAMSLFEEGFGPDRISDMTTRVIVRHLIEFNHRILGALSIPSQPRKFKLCKGEEVQASLPINPCISGSVSPVLLVPKDILRNLPIALDWSDITDAVHKNDELRNRVNTQIGKIWQKKTLKDKHELKQWALSGKGQFETFLEMLRAVEAKHYDFDGDPCGEIFWRKLAASLAAIEPLTLSNPQSWDLSSISDVVSNIIKQFKFLVEDRRYSEELYEPDGSPRPEKSAQRLFFAVAYSYCKANNLDLTPEADTGNGPVDFKVSNGFVGRVLVELKLSTNGKLVNGYTRQLEAYKKAEETRKGFYLVVDVGHMGEKDKALLETKNEAAARGDEVSTIIFVNGIRKPSASKL